MSGINNIKISVIIPVYNQERYIGQCLDTTLSQTLGNIEVICIDDGSTDGSLNVLEQYARKDSRIKVVHRENMGVGYTRNEGLRMAKGTFVAFMDPDDYYPNDKSLELLYNAAVKHDAKICGGSLQVYDEENSRLIEKKVFPDRFNEEGFLDYRQFQFDYGYQRYIFNRRLLVKSRIVFPNYKRFQDPPFFVKAMIAAGRFYRISPPTYVYRWSRRFSNWDDERVLHLVSAILDDLVLAADNGLYDLFDRTLRRIKVDFKKEIAEHPTEAVKSVMAEIMILSLKVSRARMPDRPEDRCPMVSVVLPIYNAEKYLRQCLDSLRSQTLKEMEFVCVNDGSTDKSIEIMREYADIDSRFIVIDKPNSGYGHAMNCGLDAAVGKYVGIVEPDDFVRSTMYGRLVEVAETNGVDFVKSGIIYHWENRPERVVKIVSDDSIIGRVLSPKDDVGIFNAVMNNVTGIYRRDFIERNRIRFTETPGASYQDNSFYLQVHFLAKSAYLLGESFYCYRQDNEASSINSKGKVFAIFEEYRLNERLFDGRPDVRAAFYGQYLYKKYKSYKYHFGRIDVYSQIQFMEKMAAEFRAHAARGEIDYGLMAPGQANALKAIVEDWSKYFITQWLIKVNDAKKEGAYDNCAQLEETKKSRDAAWQRHDKVAGELKEARQTLRDRYAQLEETKKSRDAAWQRHDRVAGELKEARQTLRDRYTQLEETKKSREEAWRRHDKVAGELKEARQTLRDRYAQLEETKKSREEAWRRHDKVAGELKEARQTLRDRYAQLEETKKSRDAAWQRHDKVAGELKEARSLLKKRWEERKVLLHRCEASDAKCRQLMDTIDQLNNKLNNCTERILKAEEQNETLTAFVGKLKKIVFE